MIQCEGCYYQDKKDNVCCHENPFFDIDDNCTDYIENEFVKKIRADGIREFARYLVIDGYIRYGFEADYLVNQFLKKEQNNGINN